MQWVLAALNSIEPFLFSVAEVEYFMQDETLKAARRPAVVAMAKQRLAMLEKARDGRDWFVGDGFTVADLMMGSVLKIADRLELMSELPALAAWQQSILQRPAHQKAEQDQRDEIGRHTMDDMRYDAVPDPTAA